MKFRVLSQLMIALLYLSSIHAQVLQNSIISQPAISLGQSSMVNFQIHPLKTCDTWQISRNIDHSAKLIDIQINYNYLDNCTDATGLFGENQIVSPLLTGDYRVEINLIVIQDPTLNQAVVLPNLQVQAPLTACYQNNAIVVDLCPIIYEPVCACNGQQYDNECFAYIEDRQGAYYQSTCMEIINRKAEITFCADLTSKEEGSFNTYNCNFDNYPGNEIVLRYEHDGVDVIFEYDENPDQSVFLAEFRSDGSLFCFREGSNGQLQIIFIPGREYFIVIDGKNEGDVNINLCPQTVGLEEIDGEKPYQLVNNEFGNTLIANEDLKAALYMIDGTQVLKSFIYQGDQLRLPALKGVGVLTIENRNKVFAERLISF